MTKIMKTSKQQQFPMGEVVATPGSLEAIPIIEIDAGLKRHRNGDWGEVCAEDKKANDVSLANGLRLLSAYRTAAGRVFWIITEADRSYTTVLLPEEY